MSRVTPTKIFTLEDVRNKCKGKDVWIVHDNKIYDVTRFVDDHPGGDDLIRNYAGRDVTTIMADPVEHSHSTSAYELLQEFQVGVVGAEETIVNENFVFTDHFKPKDTAVAEDYQRNRFLDLDRPLVMQVFNSNFSKSFYLQQVHQPRHLPGPARFFGPSYLEVFTVTPWYVVPSIWLPIAAALFVRSVYQQDARIGLVYAISRSFGFYLFGNLVWTILEYIFHRFLFHMDDLLPDHRFALTFHFLVHGVHHYLPMDRLRLVMPPLLFVCLSTPFTRLAHLLFYPWMANATISGSFSFYVAYDCVHYALHHTKLPAYIRQLKSHHMQHHYKEPNLGFGVTSWMWDRVFGTMFVAPPPTSIKLQ